MNNEIFYQVSARPHNKIHNQVRRHCDLKVSASVSPEIYYEIDTEVLVSIFIIVYSAFNRIIHHGMVSA